MPNRVDSFSHAIARIPGDSAADGLRAVDRGAPDPALFRSQHADYVDALGETGARVEVLEPLEDFPDAAFVEDTALCLDGGAVLMRPGAPSRQGEVDAMAPVLSRFYRRLERIAAPATLEGGDILVTPGEILVGLSARSNAEGAAQLAAIVAPWGCRVRVLRTCSIRRRSWRRRDFRPAAASTATGWCIPPSARRPRPTPSASTGCC